jgi:hypothetical protein
MLDATLEESAPSLLGFGGVVIDGIFVEGAPNMIRAGLEEQAPSFSGAVDDGITSFVFGVDEEDTIGGVDLVGDAFLAQIGHSPSVVGRNFSTILELESLAPLGLDEPGATELAGAALSELVAHSLEAISLALTATLLARCFVALDMTGVKPSSGLKLTSWS